MQVLCPVSLTPDVQVLLNIVEALFVCYALDRDRQAVTNAKVHEVYSQVRNAANRRHTATASCSTDDTHIHCHDVS
jgi:hypothetical protein